ncbi:Hypothetical Protein RSKD131_4032 [Cereibacter sphaeroides KD131]|nr:Hypothetical Protein RSKD131_4032 [Cereibacter sphaeroides KD131]
MAGLRAGALAGAIIVGAEAAAERTAGLADDLLMELMQEEIGGRDEGHGGLLYPRRKRPRP